MSEDLYCPVIGKPRELSISEMAELNHITAETLRHYDRIGLFKPAKRDPVTGYRTYLLTQCPRLDMIQFLKELGFDLNFITQQFREPDLPCLIRLFRELDNNIESEIRALERRQRILKRSIENYERFVNAPVCGTLVLEYLPAREIYVVDTGVNFYDYDRGVYEGLLRRVRENILDQGLPNLSFSNVGTIWRQKLFEEGRFYSTEFFVFMDEEEARACRTEELPSGLYLCVYCDSFEGEPLCAQKLLEELKRLDYRVTGDYICEVLSDLPILSTRDRSMYIRLQVPVSRASQNL